MATLRYIAFLAEKPEKLVDFYHRFLGTEELGRSPEGDITITDGFYNLMFFKKRSGLGEMHMDTGLHHIGLQVDDLEDVKARFLKLNPRGVIIPEPDDLQHGEIRLHDPECRPVTVSTKSFGVAASMEKKFPRVRHIAYNALDPETMLLFYTQVFNLREIPSSYERRRQGRGNRFCADGKTNLAIHPFYSPGRRPRSEIRRQPHRFSNQRDARDDSGIEHRLENRIAPVDQTLRRVPLPPSRRQRPRSITNQRLRSRRRQMGKRGVIRLV